MRRAEDVGDDQAVLDAVESFRAENGGLDADRARAAELGREIPQVDFRWGPASCGRVAVIAHDARHACRPVVGVWHGRGHVLCLRG